MDTEYEVDVVEDEYVVTTTSPLLDIPRNRRGEKRGGRGEDEPETERHAKRANQKERMHEEQYDREGRRAWMHGEV